MLHALGLHAGYATETLDKILLATANCRGLAMYLVQTIVVGTDVYKVSSLSPKPSGGWEESPREWQAISAGSDHTCGLLTSGALFCW